MAPPGSSGRRAAFPKLPSKLSVVLSSFRSFAIILFLLFQFVETRPVFTMPRPEVSRSLRVNYLPGFTDLSP